MAAGDPNDPARIKATIKCGSKSTHFRNLVAVNGEMIASTYISYGTSTKMNLTSGKISIKDNSLMNDEVLAYTHELSNRMHRGNLKKAQEEVKSGEISPEQYADKVLEIEVFGIRNKIIVASEMDIKYNSRQEFVDAFKEGKIGATQVLEYVKDALSTAESTDTGESARTLYINRAKQLQENNKDEEKK